jgi:hypothetical protein
MWNLADRLPRRSARLAANSANLTASVCNARIVSWPCAVIDN